MKLILLPGVDGTGRLFERLRAALPSSISTQVISYDDAPAQDYDTLCAFVSARLPARDPFVLLGESFSGPIAVRVAAETDRCRGVVLAASFVRAPLALPSWARRFTGPLKYFKVPDVAARIFLLNGNGDAALVTELAATLRQVPAKAIAARLAAVATVDARDALTRLTVPVLYLRAEHDRLVGRRSAQEISLYGDDVTTLEMDAPHMVLQACPQECARGIAKFITGIESIK